MTSDPTGPTGETTFVDEVRRPRRHIDPEPLSHVPALDGLRALAVVAVMLYHARFGWISGGFLGVSAFFTLSGFLITSLLLREWCTSVEIDIRQFWGRRFRRLLPASWTTIGAVLVLGAAGVWNGDQLRALRGDVPFSLLNIVNWHFVAQDRTYGAGFTSPSPLEHFWSLAVEEQFYLVLPLLVMIALAIGSQRVPRRRLTGLMVILGVLTALGAATAGIAGANSTDRAYFGTDTRMAEMLVGALLACLTLRHLRLPIRVQRRLAGAAGIIALGTTAWLWHVASVDASWMYPWGFLLCALCTALIILAGLQNGTLANVLGLGPFVWLGRISYGVYLIHWPVFLILSPSRVSWGQWPLFAIRVAVTLAAATLMFHFVEEPIRRRRRLVGRRLLLAGCGSLVVLALSTVLVTRNPAPTSAVQRASSAGVPSTTIPVPPIRVLVVGDQTAAAIGTAIAGDGDLRVSTSVVDDCGLTVGGWLILPDGSVEHDVRRCGSAAQTWSEQIVTQQPDVVLVIPGVRDAFTRAFDEDVEWAPPGHPSTDDFLRSDLGRTLDDLSSTAATVNAELVVMSLPKTINQAPPPLPPRTPNPDPNKEALSALQEAQIIQSAPDLGQVDGLGNAVPALNLVLRQVAESRSLEFLDLSAMLVYLGGGSAAVDIRPSAQPIPPGVADPLGRWIHAETKPDPNATVPPPTVVAPGGSTQIPPAPPPRPRRHTPAGQKPSILVIGDSVAFSLGEGLADWAGRRGTANVVVGAKFGCPIARGGRYRFQRESLVFEDRCDWADFAPKLVRGHQPDVVVLSSGIWEVVDRQLEGDDRFRHIGDPQLDDYVLAEFVRAVDTLGSDGATVAVVTQPHMASGLDQGFQGLPESEPARIDHLNELLRRVVELRPEVATLVDLQGYLGSQPGREMDPARRPDGIHFSDEEGVAIAGDWLGEQLTSLARGR